MANLLCLNKTPSANVWVGQCLIRCVNHNDSEGEGKPHAVSLSQWNLPQTVELMQNAVTYMEVSLFSESLTQSSTPTQEYETCKLTFHNSTSNF